MVYLYTNIWCAYLSVRGFEADVSYAQRAKIDKNLFEIIKSRLPGEQNMWI